MDLLKTPDGSSASESAGNRGAASKSTDLEMHRQLQRRPASDDGERMISSRLLSSISVNNGRSCDLQGVSHETRAHLGRLSTIISKSRESAAGGAEAPPISILAVNDNSMVTMILDRILSNLGFAVTTLPSAEMVFLAPGRTSSVAWHMPTHAVCRSSRNRALLLLPVSGRTFCSAAVLPEMPLACALPKPTAVITDTHSLQMHECCQQLIFAVFAAISHAGAAVPPPA